jgi:lysophospholipase L1-like esterase
VRRRPGLASASMRGGISRLGAIVGIAVSAVVAASCSSSSTATPADYYVSLGDSYAAGYQPTGQGVGHTTTNGFAYQVVGMATHRGYHFTLANFGCGGATTTSLLTSVGCPPGGLGPNGEHYPTMTQAAAAEQFLRQHRGHVGLITVSIGGNDVTHCATVADPTSCVISAIATIKTNLATLLPALRSAAGASVPIVGITYPDVLLGLWVSGQPSDQNLAKLSVTAFQSLLNPALSTAYSAVGGAFVDVTAATGAYTPLDQTTTLAPYGTVPVAVAKACELTFYCEFHDIHPMTAGYTVIADLVTADLPEH